MFNSILKNPILVATVVSLLVNLVLFSMNSNYRGEIESLSTERAQLEQQLIKCSNDNTTWKHSYDNLMSSCQIQSEVIISLANDLQNERKESGDIVRDILLLSPEQCSTQQPTNTGGSNEDDNPPRVAGIDDRLDSSLIGMLQRAYSPPNIRDSR